MSNTVDLWRQEEKAGYSSRDLFSPHGRIIEEPLPWNYEKWLRDFLKPGTKLLDMGTGGGEFLLGLRHKPELVSATEGHMPSYLLSQKRMEPLGIKLAYVKDGAPLPFEDESFNLVINRHNCYSLEEVYRILKKGGHFISQQKGAQDGVQLARRLGLSHSPKDPMFNLENQVSAIGKAGFRVVKSAQAYPSIRFTDTGAICVYAAGIFREFGSFSVDKCLDKLLCMEQERQSNGYIETKGHRFIFTAKKGVLQSNG